MGDQSDTELKFKRLLTFIAILLVLFGQLYVFGSIDEKEKGFPIQFWITFVGVDLFI